MGWDGMGWDGMDGMGWDGMGVEEDSKKNHIQYLAFSILLMNLLTS